jgi:hypothetical protein
VGKGLARSVCRAGGAVGGGLAGGFGGRREGVGIGLHVEICWVLG